jgi:hypothetical protein
MLGMALQSPRLSRATPRNDLEIAPRVFATVMIFTTPNFLSIIVAYPSYQHFRSMSITFAGASGFGKVLVFAYARSYDTHSYIDAKGDVE